MSDKHQCEEMVRDRNCGVWPSSHQCPRNGIIERDGKWYCKQHDPVALKERREKEWLEFQAKMSDNVQARERKAANERLGELVRKMPVLWSLTRGNTSRWRVATPADELCGAGDTPEEALREALKEGE